MKRVIGSSWFAAVAFAVTSVGLIAMLYQRVEPFRYYGRGFGVAPFLPDAGVTTVLLLVAAAYLLVRTISDASGQWLGQRAADRRYG